jgi:hypothetical protein
MLTTTRRGWWLALEPALLAFAIVVCGSVSLLAYAHASAGACDHLRDTSGSIPSTVAAASRDSFDDGDDDGDDDDDVGAALPAAPIVLTSDEGPGAPVVRIELDVLSSLRSERVYSRGPPDRDLPSWTADSDSSDHNIDDDDDDDDDGDSSDLGNSSTASDRGQTWILILPEFGALFSVASDDHSLRAPPQ